MTAANRMEKEDGQLAVVAACAAGGIVRTLVCHPCLSTFSQPYKLQPVGAGGEDMYAFWIQ